MNDTINIPRAELQAALDALTYCRQKIAYLIGNVEWYEPEQAIDFADMAIKTLRTRLAQQEEKPEPVAWFDKKMNGLIWKEGLLNCHFDDRQPFYTAPPRREWQGLTDEEKETAYDLADMDVGDGIAWVDAKLKEKNRG